MKRLALVSLVGANLLVALQVLRHDWGYYETILIFWCEALSHGVSFVCNFVIGREYQRMMLFELIFLPYLRMGLVAMVLAAGLVAVRLLPGLASATPFAVVMVLGKLAADLVSHTVEHEWIGARPYQQGGGVQTPPVEAPPVQRAAASSSGSGPFPRT